METCPTCGETFETERGVSVHHAKIHGVSIAGEQYTCDHCGETFQAQPTDERQFCSVECSAANKSERMDSPFGGERNGVVLTCEWCGDEYRRAAANAEGSRFCSRDCQSAAQSVEFSSDDWHLSGATGADHPSYTGHEDYYGENWDEQRRAALERDGYECIICGMGRSEHREEHGCDLHVHHIRPIATHDTPEAANSLSNLITLCRPHHAKWEGVPVAPEVVQDERGLGTDGPADS